MNASARGFASDVSTKGIPFCCSFSYAFYETGVSRRRVDRTRFIPEIYERGRKEVEG